MIHSMSTRNFQWTATLYGSDRLLLINIPTALYYIGVYGAEVDAHYNLPVQFYHSKAQLQYTPSNGQRTKRWQAVRGRLAV